MGEKDAAPASAIVAVALAVGKAGIEASLPSHVVEPLASEPIRQPPETDFSASAATRTFLPWIKYCPGGTVIEAMTVLLALKLPPEEPAM